MHEGQHHGKVGEQQPFDRTIHQADRDQGVVDQAVTPQQRDPGNHADDIRGPERNRAQDEEHRLHGAGAYMERQKIGHRKTDRQSDQPYQQAEF